MMADSNKPNSKEKNNSLPTPNDFNSHTNLVAGAANEVEYNTADYRDQIKGQTYGDALAHFLKSSLGSGILAMPMAFSNGGLLFGGIATLVTGFICAHCVHILVKTSQDLCKEVRVPSLSFAETAEKAFEFGPKRLRSWSNFARLFVDYGLMATYYAAACVYMVFIATSFYEVISYDTTFEMGKRYYIALTIIPCLLIGQIRNLKWLVPFSAIANVFIVITFGIVLYYLFNEPLVFSDKPLVANISKIPLFFSTVIFAMEGIGSVMPVENSMKKPQQFLGCPGVLNVSMVIVVVLYATLGFFGYVRYGNGVKGSITLNLEKGDAWADTAKILMAVAILFTYGLQFYVPNEILWKKISHKFNEKNHNIVQILLRAGIIVVSGCIGIALPNLELFINLVGAIFFSLLGILVPSVCETVYLWPDRFGSFKWILWKNIFLCAFAIFALVSGSTVSIIKIAEEL
ncbi:proton-coupled amino acid transporter-like protein pathetic [Ceratitis capitata]|uniref:(Mediterranean fruit fly) hypothetical protein n=1 Tax=Ceratitis capitata TaxID=7213 RepID=W8BC78_CERCA|nr:proton-coupled amino acid transporter-like protein pathetic [Ceratitis capitata]CAD7012211.1 unnamed protein product [Ceratitis capitata]